jgi:N-acetylmuramoyl-L-alanine amidase
MRSAAAALERMRSPEAKVSAHYMVEEGGRLISMVPETERAWHAGVSHWLGKESVNDRSIGIEIVNPGHEFGYRPFPRSQIESVIELCTGILERHPISPDRVLGHSDVAPSRKEDPGELFPWRTLSEAGIGKFIEPHAVRPSAEEPLGPGDSGDAVRTLQKRFRAFGYGIEISTEYDLLTEKVVRAFQRHFRPETMDGLADPHCQAVLKAYLSWRNIRV